MAFELQGTFTPGKVGHHESWSVSFAPTLVPCVQAKVSLLAHSLGSVLTWDILTAQPRLYHSLASHHGDSSLAALEALSRGTSPPGGGSPPATALGPRPTQVCCPLVPSGRTGRALVEGGKATPQGILQRTKAVPYGAGYSDCATP